MGRGNSRTPFIENRYYHIYNRGYNKSIIFNNDSCFKKFYTYLVMFLKDYEDSIKIVSYSFLPNHFHIIIHYKTSDSIVDEITTNNQNDISKFMKNLQGSYSIWHRTKYPLNTLTKQPFFEGRFKAKLITDEDYLIKCISYVNFNAIKHEIVEKIEDYKWSSYHQVDKSKIEKYKNLILNELEI